MKPIIVEHSEQRPVEEQRVEIVERKGLGHPDSICDAVAEQVSLALCREYLAVSGRVLHHNIDKALLVAGRTEPRLGGGVVIEPMRLVLGDRATAELRRRRIDVGSLAEEAARSWLRGHLRFVDPERHVVFQNELREGSPELTDLFEREEAGANDTSAAVGFAPLTSTERLVLATERFLNSAELKRRFPETGEDVKVMGCRRDRELLLTVAVAFVDRLVPDAKTYFARKAELAEVVQSFVEKERGGLARVEVEINTLDDPDRGEGGLYLTVLGTSAESADGGQIGRGNRVNGLITLHRPMSIEAAAGKNPVRHVGKIYSLLAHQVAGQMVERVPGIREAYVWLCSQIGRPLREPWVASVRVLLEPGVELGAVQPGVEAILERNLAEVQTFTERLIRGELPVC
jgi:S-adenosylmethionine synthetase